ncbi:MAG: hypothetical protein K8R36_20445 [Planctomycetales bacterium]|nr:hypothetical protein [Planctomycetales bacterium]
MTSRWISRLCWTAVAMIIVILPISCTVTTGARNEFSPQTLEFRSRREVWVGYGMFPIYISGPKYSDHRLLHFLRDKAYVTPSESPSPRWIELSHWNHAWRDGDHRTFSRSRTVIAWSEEDSERAQLFWSECFRLLRSDHPVEQSAGEMLLGQPFSYRDCTEVQQMIDSSLEFAAEKDAYR